MVDPAPVRFVAALPLAFALALDIGAAATGPQALPAAAPASADRGEALFSADFQSGRPKGMTFDRDGVWSVVDGKLRAQLPDRKQQRSFAYVGSAEWADYAVEFDVCGVLGVDKGVAVRADGASGVGIDLRSDGYNDVVMYRGFSHLGRAPAPNRNAKWYHLRVEVQGNRYRVYVNRALKLEYRDEENRRPRGRIALAAYTGGAGACVVYFDNLVVTRIGKRS